MTTIEERRALEALVADAFQGGERRRRELRLTPREAQQLRAYARLTPMDSGGGEKRWYMAELKGACQDE